MGQRLCAWMVCSVLTTAVVAPGLTTLTPAIAQTTESGEKLLQQGFSLMQAERLGQLRLDQPGQEVDRRLVRCPRELGPEQFWGATGEYVEQWRYPTCGISLYMSSEKPGGAKTIFSMRIERSSTLKTKRGIGIGSPASAVMKAYGQFYNPADSRPGQSIVAGTVYGGVIFTLKNNRVTSIFVGAAAE